MFLLADVPTFTLEQRIPLSVMNFLEFAIWGAWFVVLGNYLNTLKFSRKDIGRIYATMSLGAIISPMFVGAIADRYFASQQLMGILHLIGAGLLYWMAQIKTPRAFYWVALAYALVYSPTLSLSNAVIFATVPQTLDFPSIRVLGTIGWIVAGLSLALLIKKGESVNNKPLLLAAFFSLILGVYPFFLPDAPPQASGSGAEAKPVMGVFLNVKEGGSGYKSAPEITLESKSGSGARAEAEVKDGKVTAVKVTEPGKGYTEPPTVKLSGGGGSGAEVASSLTVVGGEVVKGGSGYKSKRILSAVGKGENVSAAALLAELGDEGAVKGITVVSGGSGYTEPVTLAFPEPGIPFIKALNLLTSPSRAVFFGVSFLITIALAFYYSFTALYLERGVKVQAEHVGPLMTIGQWVEIVFMLTLGWFLTTFGMRYVLILGMAAWGLRYGIFAAQPPLGLIIIGIGLHGICFDFFFAAAMIHTADHRSHRRLQTVRNLSFGVLTYGLGMYIGTEASGWLNQKFTRDVTDPVTGTTTQVTDWCRFWLVPCIGVVICLVVFVIFF